MCLCVFVSVCVQVFLFREEIHLIPPPRSPADIAILPAVLSPGKLLLLLLPLSHSLRVSTFQHVVSLWLPSFPSPPTHSHCSAGHGKPSMTLFLCRNLSIDITVDPDVYTMVGTEVFTLVAQDASQPLTSSTSAVFTIRGLWVPSSCRPILLGGCILSSLGPLVSLASLPTVAIGRSDSVD